ncbi:MAG: hypothetical protein NVSMB7_03910 [Chitinophagaceae bacterium]
MEKRSGLQKDWGTMDGKQRRIINLADGSEKPVGEWNTMVIQCRGNTIKTWVNNDFVNDGFNCTASKRQIALQAEGSEVAFRKVEITKL